MTPSGKPPLDEQPLGSGWNAGGNGAAPTDDGNADPPTPRQAAAHAPSAPPPLEGDASRPVYGTGVPYGGDDRTEEIDPIALDAPFVADEQKRAAPATVEAPRLTPTPAAPPAAPRKAPAASLRDNELKAPVTQLALSDLFDSTPPPAFMAPPDPAAFSSSRPPPAKSPSPTFESSPVTSAVVALPSINVVGDTASSAPRASRSAAPAPAVTPSRPATPVPPETGVAAPEAPESVPQKRQSVPTLESAAPKASPSSPARSKNALPGAPSTPPPPRDSTPAEVPRFPSDVPTSRPPDVTLSQPRAAGPALRQPAPSSASAPEGRSSQSFVVMAPPSVQVGKDQLPSIMLGADVEAEPDNSTKRAMRAARATVRIELPPNFGQPGSPLPGHRASVATTQVNAVAQPAPPVTSLAGLGSNRVAWFAAASVVLVVLLFLAFRPRTGSLVVTALAPGNRPVDNVQIFVDGDPLCTNISPCRIEGLSRGEHALRAVAPGLASAGEQSVVIEAGEEAIFNIDLVPAAAPEVKAGSLSVAAGATDLTLFVDGKRVGKLPQTVSGLSGGKHWIKLDPEDGTAPIEKAVTIVPGETIETDPKAAQRDKALVTIRLSPGSEGASVTLDDAFLLDFPAELELEPNSAHTLTATKPGYEDLKLDVRVEKGESEKLIEVAMTPLDGTSPPRKSKAKPRKAAAPKAASAVGDATQGLLNISSVPPSQIILNGRPLGSTPKTSIAVPGDSLQTIVFVHPKMGRRRAQKFVPAGKERTVSIRF